VPLTALRQRPLLGGGNHYWVSKALRHLTLTNKVSEYTTLL